MLRIVPKHIKVQASRVSHESWLEVEKCLCLEIIKGKNLTSPGENSFAEDARSSGVATETVRQASQQ